MSSAGIARVGGCLSQFSVGRLILKRGSSSYGEFLRVAPCLNRGSCMLGIWGMLGFLCLLGFGALSCCGTPLPDAAKESRSPFHPPGNRGACPELPER